MDRDAAPAESVAAVVPPFEWSFVRKVGIVGSGLVAGAAVLGLVATAMGSPPWVIHTARLFLVFGGAITTGAAVSMRPDLWQAWALGAVTGALAVAGTPAHWDSFRLLFGVCGAVAAAWAVALLVSVRYRLYALSAVMVFHFAGIFFATTSPPSTPWVTEQAFIRVYNPYLQFLYLRNAYHFYSPEPGPASVIVCLLKTETGTDAQGRKVYETRWVVLPKRPADVKDPLGLTYYRRLSITEQIARATPALLQPVHVAEKNEMLPRRRMVLRSIPLHPAEEETIQYRLPQPEVARFVLPSYASHIILENTDAAGAGKTTVKIYRLEHKTLSVEEFTNVLNRPGVISSPYHPSTYRPYFLGEFGFVPDPDKPGATHIELLNPQEPMLYWLVPIGPRPGGRPPGDPDKREFIDYMSIHALDTLNLSERDVDDPQYRDKVFDWNQLR
ncbi:hypothetical protein J8F10_17810 [Gemmata sp. G18]|uniref:Uncharacterized protein n=1 Tax=Gemmata palustris TaxID=2822762 RepID=A0ABS5BTV2_9BACT|nr:hypothetical protein [Gemmata palustris]MBP3957124.1 hypothetical protein [Gemmata palustris]